MNATAQPDFSEYQDCHLCPRDCGVDRTAGVSGQCGQTSICRVASALPHFGEEPCFTGTRGSGTVFFTGCSTACFFCQNYQISHEDMGYSYNSEALLQLVTALADKGVHNINFVTPDHFWPHVQFVCRELRKRGCTLPFIINSSGYHREDMIATYAEDIDIFMPDFKFAEPDLAQQCMGDFHYPEIALKALIKMVEAKGFLSPWNPDGKETAESGVLVRHLVLPGYIPNSLKALCLLRREFGPMLPISVMSQFRPTPCCAERRLLTRTLTAGEFQEVVATIEELGFVNAYIQSIPDTDKFTPDFSKEEPFEGNRRTD